MESIISWAVRLRFLVLAVAAAVLGFGVVHLRTAPVDVLPEFTPTYTEIQTEALGLSADEVEQLITVPLEADLLNGVEGVDVIRSQSLSGLSSIVLVFAPGTDVYQARQLVEERLTQAHALPNVSKPPMLLQPLSSSSRVLMIGLASSSLSPIEQSVIARWTIRPRLMGVAGVANVSVWGMRDQQLQVQVDPARLRAQNITLGQVIRSAGNAQVVSPLSFLEASTPGTGGFVESPQQRLQVRHVLEQLADPADLGDVPVDGTAGRLKLSDVATITVDHQPLIGDAVVAGRAGLMLVVEKLPGADVRAVTDGVEQALETLRPGLSGLETTTSAFRPASYLDRALDNLALALGAGAVLLLLGLVAARRHWRAVVVAVATAVVSFVTAAVVLDLLGQGFNVIVLAGLAAAITVVVDLAVAAARRGAGQHLAYPTLILLLPVVPLVVMQGRPGAFFAPLALAYALAVVAAVLVALTVGPALMSFLVGRPEASAQVRPRPERLGRHYGELLHTVTGRPRRAAAVAILLAGAGLAALPLLSLTPVPQLHDRDVLVQLETEPGTASPRMADITADAARRLEAVPGVTAVAAHIGRAVTGDRVANVNSGDIWVGIDADADYDRTRARIDAVVRALPVVDRDVVTYSTQALREVAALTDGAAPASGSGLDLLTGSVQPVSVRLFGQDPAVLREQAEKVRNVMAQVDGVVEPRVDAPVTQPTIEIEVDLARAQRHGITPGDVRRAEATLLQGIQVGSIFQQQKVFDVIVQGAPSTRESVQDVRDLLLDKPGGGHVTLGEVADVRVVQSAAVIKRDAVSRRLDVTTAVSGRDASDVAAEVEIRLRAVDFPLEYHAEVVAAGSASELGSGRLIGFAVGCAVAAFLLMQAAFRGWRLALLGFAGVFVGLVGGVVVALVDGATLSLGSLVGLLALFGLGTRMTMALLAGLADDDERGSREAVVDRVHRVARDRLAPTLTTSAVLAALALPFAVLGSRPGLELLHGTAFVLLGGILTTVAVTVVLLPGVYVAVFAPATVASSEPPPERVPPVDSRSPVREELVQ